jgi:hypothetical protein
MGLKIGDEFTIDGVDKRWRVTDVGTRTIVAICLDKGEDTSWYNGPPYAVAETVFDEDDIAQISKVTTQEGS